MSVDYVDKIKRGCAIVVFHGLLYCGGCAVFIIIGLSHAASKINLSSASGIMATAGSFLMLFPAWVLFTVIWVLAVSAVRVIRKSMLRRANLEKHIVGSGMRAAEFQTVIADGREKAATMRSVAHRIGDAAVSGKMRAIADSSSRIYDCLEKDPATFRRAKQFLNYYNDAALTIIKKYEFLKAGKQTEEIAVALREVESALDTINDSFQRQHTRLLDGSLTDIEVELSLLKKMLRSEGLS